MRHFILAIIATISLFMTGCGNLSPQANPKLDQKIDNQQGKIGEIESMQNSLKVEMGKLQSQADIQNSRLDRIQQGLLNFQHNEDNNGIQIFSGSGGLIVAILGFTGLFIVIIYYRKMAVSHEKTANILAERIVHHGDPSLVDAVFQAALHTNVEEIILNLIKKHQK